MLNPFVWLTLLSATMLVGSFIFGCIPLSTKLSESKLRQLTAIGVGLLIGTSLVVIIPEGVETLYSSTLETTAAHQPSASQSDWMGSIPPNGTAIPSVTSVPWSSPSPPSHKTIENPQLVTPHHHDDTWTMPTHTSVGLALIIGFAVMFLIDQYSSLHAHVSPQDPDNNDTPHSLTPTIGLIVHAAADGIALGASANHPQLSMVVFFAIMLHKGPSAFALTTVLLAEGFSRSEVRKHLLMFSVAAPLGALTTYLLLAFTGDMDLAYWTGVLLLFSGGTFFHLPLDTTIDPFGTADQLSPSSFRGSLH
ncbi:hypothetical protein [Absidia glauca]|uniref:Zinc/iron permease n=1 Tax=Absidia glauca TaxID=4829 RepID=A0A168PZN4_ABSGL|nr:hypothetical protein [Absidia glauca]